MANRSALALALSCVACAGSARLGADATGGPSIVVPAHFAEREPSTQSSKAGPSKIQGGGSADAGAAVEPQRASPLPDPPPLVTASHWLYRFEYSKGTVRVTKVVRKEFDKPVPTERRVGRFAVELWVGRELVDRVRFDFPLLAADPAPEGRKHALRAPTAFGPGAETSREVLVPASDRATRAVLVDRLDGHSTVLAWPPDLPEPPNASDAAP